MRRLITITALSAITLLLVLPAALAQSPQPFEDDASYETESRRGKRGVRGPDGRRGGRGMRGVGISPRMAEELELTDAQNAEIQAIRDALREQTSPARETVRELRTELRELWSADEPDQKAIVSKMDQMQAEKHAMAIARVEAKLQVLDVLTPEQKDEMKAIRAERRERRTERRSERGERKRGDCDGQGYGRGRGSWGD